MNQTYFLVFQFTKRSLYKSQSAKQGLEQRPSAESELMSVRQLNVDLVVTSLQVFYNKNLIKRTQSFIN